MTADTHWKGAVMAYITCEDLALGYEGKAVTEHIHFNRA